MSDFAALRPELHRYCARMLGSYADGEDVVQDALERAQAERDSLRDEAALRAWLFRIAHHRALDVLRRHERRFAAPLDDDGDDLPDGAPPPDEILARREAVSAALARFVALPPGPRSCVILKDVLGMPLDAIAGLLELSIPAVKAALHRGRAKLRETPAPPPRETPPELARYVALFNARDWDGVRALLADDVKLDLVGRGGRAAVYTSNYAALDDWRFSVGAGVIHATSSLRGDYRIELEIANGRVTRIRDYRYTSYDFIRD
ncbi:MAG TPA: sigma-70 family RNA polymerase sigma factor [Kofleriaceae bacterium]|jgi:RNA polymerase sigma-70 factor (ECF subfamily)